MAYSSYAVVKIIGQVISTWSKILVAVGEDAEDCETEHIKEYDKADELYYEIEYRHQDLAYYFHIVLD